MSKKVFLNTSPIQYIYQLGLIRIVKELFGKVYVPAEVHEELNRGLDFILPLSISLSSLKTQVKTKDGEFCSLILSLPDRDFAKNNLLI